jgi:hypothetical protein
VYELDPTQRHLLPDDVAEALDAPGAALAEVFAGSSGAGPLDKLTAAAVVDSAAPYRNRGELDETSRLGEALAALAAVLPMEAAA